jgi:hypothetical protein
VQLRMHQSLTFEIHQYVTGAEFYALREFAFDRYKFKILTVERPKDELGALLMTKGYEQLCILSNFGESLWVHEDYKGAMDLASLPRNCRLS